MESGSTGRQDLHGGALYKAAAIDLGKIYAVLAKLAPYRMTTTDMLNRLRDRLLEQQGK